MYSLEESRIAIAQVPLIETNNEILELQDIVTEGLNTSLLVDNLKSIVYTKKESELSIECLKLSMSIIYENIGAKYYTTSLEDYTINNQSIAIESMNNFVKELWVKIKTSIIKLWDKVSDFWNNNFSSLNKIKSSLESTLLQIEMSYKVNSTTISKTEDKNILDSFNNSKDVDEKTLENFIVAHELNFNKINELLKHTKHFNGHIKSIAQSEFNSDIDSLLGSLSKDFTYHPFRFGQRNYPIVGGEYVTIEYSFDKETSDINVSTEKEKIESDENRDIYLINNNKLKGLIRKTLNIINETIKYKEIQKSIEKEFNNLIAVYDKLIIHHDFESKDLVEHYDKVSAIHDKDNNINYKKIIRLVYRINSSIPGLFGIVVLSNVKLARSIVHYSNYCLKEQ